MRKKNSLMGLGPVACGQFSVHSCNGPSGMSIHRRRSHCAEDGKMKRMILRNKAETKVIARGDVDNTAAMIAMITAAISQRASDMMGRWFR